MEIESPKLGSRVRPLIAPAVFAALTLTMFADLLVVPRGRVISHQTTDLALQFIPWRQFGFSELREGNLALWNPHIFGGVPYFAGFQSALLYPPNWLHLILPIGPAINWIVAFHVFLAGYFTYMWVRFRGASMTGAILAGAMFMFSGPYFLHIYAGHLPHLAVMVWTPLILLAIDGIAATGSWRWFLLGVVAVAMQIFAGHPQYVYYTGIAVSLYVALLLTTSSRRATLSLGFIAIYLGGAMLAAVQLLPGIEAQRESVRNVGTGFEFASTFSLPPQNLITLLAPNFFGSLPMKESAGASAGSYWGAGYLWEMSIFASVTGLFLAVYGAVGGARRGNWVILAMIAITLVLALGRHTPLYRPMFDWLPKYDSFRGTVKFANIMILFVSLLAAIGFDALVRRERTPTGWMIVLVSFAVFMMLLAWSISRSPDWWTEWVSHSANSAASAQELFTRTVAAFDDPVQRKATRDTATKALLFGSSTLLLVSAILFASRLRRAVVFALPVVLVVELFVFAYCTRDTMPIAFGFPEDAPRETRQVYDAWRSALQKLPPEFRAFNSFSHLANLAMSLNYKDVWGYDPGVLRRYAELMAISQGGSAKNASQYLLPRRLVPSIFRALRCKLILLPRADAPIFEIQDPLPIATVVSDWVQLKSAESSVAYMMNPSFDARQTVVLEEAPGIATRPASEPAGSARVLQQGTDFLDIRTELSRPAILLITNAYSSGWRVRPLSASAQTPYRIVPADWALQAIPLEAGTHHLRVEYLPAAFVVGKWISIASLIAFASIGTGVLLMNRRASLR